MSHPAGRSGKVSFRNDPKDAQGLCTAGERRRRPDQTTAAGRGGSSMLVLTARTVLCLCLALAFGAQAAEPRETRPPSDDSRDPAPVEQPKEAEKSKPVPRTFVPSEQIKADSAVSFPVDI